MKKTFILLCGLALMSGCYYDVEEELYPDNTTSACDTTVTGYAARITPMMAANCAYSGCHVAGGQSPDLSNYAEVSANSALIQQRAIIDKDMPPAGPMSQCDIDALQRWINNGSLNN